MWLCILARFINIFLYHNPNKKDDMSEEDDRGQQKVKDSSSNHKSEECTMSTDKVD